MDCKPAFTILTSKSRNKLTIVSFMAHLTNTFESNSYYSLYARLRMFPKLLKQFLCSCKDSHLVSVKQKIASWGYFVCMHQFLQEHRLGQTEDNEIIQLYSHGNYTKDLVNGILDSQIHLVLFISTINRIVLGKCRRISIKLQEKMAEYSSISSSRKAISSECWRM